MDDDKMNMTRKTSLPVLLQRSLTRLSERLPAQPLDRAILAGGIMTGGLLAWHTLKQRLSATTALTRSSRRKEPASLLSHSMQARLLQQPRQTGVYNLITAIEALVVRIQLIRAAQHELLIQYYIWDDDAIGWLFMHEIRQAALRGVKVSLLLDDNGVPGRLDNLLVNMADLPNVDVRLFNPFRLRHLTRLDFLLNFNRAQRRMHNKALVADRQVAIIGGRNIGDAYFRLNTGHFFSDFDVLLVGQAVPEVMTQFQNFWSDPLSQPVGSAIGKRALWSAAQWQSQFSDRLGKLKTDPYLLAARQLNTLQQLQQDKLPVRWQQARLVADRPTKVSHPSTRIGGWLDGLLSQLKADAPIKQLDIISAYFVPGDEGTAFLIKLAQQGAQIRVLTNSLAAGDVPALHDFYARQRPALLKAGIRLFEFRSDLLSQLDLLHSPVATDGRYGLDKPLVSVLLRSSQLLSQLSKRISVLGWLRLSRKRHDASLHTKIVSWNQQQVFIGSANLDPRSAFVNTELGMIMDNPDTAIYIDRLFNDQMQGAAWEVRLDEKGQIFWTGYQRNLLGRTRARTVHREPDASWTRRITAKLVGLFPVERYM